MFESVLKHLQYSGSKSTLTSNTSITRVTNLYGKPNKTVQVVSKISSNGNIVMEIYGVSYIFYCLKGGYVHEFGEKMTETIATCRKFREKDFFC